MRLGLIATLSAAIVSASACGSSTSPTTTSTTSTVPPSTISSTTSSVPATVPPTCSFSVSPTTLPTVRGGGGTVTFTVTAPTGCAWTAATSASFITVSSGASGTGSGTVTISVTATPGQFRSGIVTSAGVAITVGQDAGVACVTFSPASISVPATASTGSVSVTAPDTCGWQVTTTAAFITITSGPQSLGNAVVTFAIAANTATTARSGVITIGTLPFTVNQAAGAPATTNAQYGSGAGTGNSLDISLFFTVAGGALAPNNLTLIVHPLATYQVTGTLTANPNSRTGTVQGTLNGTPASGSFDGTIFLDFPGCRASRHYSGSVTSTNLNWNVFSELTVCSNFSWPFGSVVATGK